MHINDRVITFLFCIVCILSISGCRTKTFTFKAGKGAKVSLVSPNKLDDDGTVLGETPISVELKKLVGKVIKISQNGKLPVYWFVTDTAGDNTEANIKLLDDPTAIGEKSNDSKLDPKVAANRLLRLLMRSYQALSGKRFKDARELADQAGKIDPEIAAPLLIKGLAYYQEGNIAEAKAALAKAQALDPEDKDIGTLLKTVR